MVKMSLKKILGRAFITLTALQTIIVEVEATLNDRPLTYLSSTTEDPEPLTPSHLLCGHRIVPLPHPIARLYPLEVSADEHSTVSTDDGAEGPSQEETEQRDDHDDSDTRGQRPVRMAMVKARDQVAEWSRILRRPPEDVEDN